MYKAIKKTLIEFPANKRNGLFVSYYEDGQKLEEANYIMTEMDAETIQSIVAE